MERTRKPKAVDVRPSAHLTSRGSWALLSLVFFVAFATVASRSSAKASQAPWMNASLEAGKRADLVLGRMTVDEKLRLVLGSYAFSLGGNRPPDQARAGSAGYIAGIDRLGIPPLWETDGPVGVAGVANHDPIPVVRERTSLPSGLATAATWNSEIAFAGGAMIGSEARSSGFNMMLGGAVNLERDPRNGRNFEYAGEDPLLAGTIGGGQIRGIQSNRILATIKHFAFNDQETGRTVANAVIDDAAARESDLLAFQIAIETGRPAAVMCAYNRVNGDHACESSYLLDRVLKRDWQFPGFVMSDWGGVHSTVEAANRGLDQESGHEFDDKTYFGDPLRSAVASGSVSTSRLDDMARRVLRSMFANGAVDNPIHIAPIDFAADAKVAQADEEQAIVMLKNDRNMLPLEPTVRRIAIVGSHADKGVLSGGGSSQVDPVGGNSVPGLGPNGWPGPTTYFPSSPMAELALRMPSARITYDDGADPARAASIARDNDVAIVFVHQWSAESFDQPDLSLPDDQDGMVSAVAAANPHTIVVLETSGPVTMPWLPNVRAVLEAWYPGSAGGVAIARVLLGAVEPSGRLPVTFPAAEMQLPRAKIDGTGRKNDDPFEVYYFEGAAVGYKWFDSQHLSPLFPFGYGLGYTQFSYARLKAVATGNGVSVRFTARNVGDRDGSGVPQVYVGPSSGGWEAPRRLGGWKKIELAANGSADLSLAIDPRLLATWDIAAQAWQIKSGDYAVWVGNSSRDLPSRTLVRLRAQTLPVQSNPRNL